MVQPKQYLKSIQWHSYNVSFFNAFPCPNDIDTPRGETRVTTTSTPRTNQVTTKTTVGERQKREGI